MGVLALSLSLCLEDGVLELDEMLLCGDPWGSFFSTLSVPFSRGDSAPLGAPTELTSLATSTTNSWSLFSPSLS
ncbi:unnamed protein product, partial [Ixodes persulcatus]